MTARLALAAALLGGCNYLTDSFVINTFSGDPFPTTVDTSSGAIVVGVQEQDLTMRTAVLDVLSPITLIDRGPDVAQSVDYPPLVLVGEHVSGGPFDLPRARFEAPQVLTLHPCAEPTCAVGTPTSPRPFDAIIGLDTFASDALRLHLAADPTTDPDQIFILPDIGGDETHRTRACDAVFPTPFRGGGTLLVGGTELAFSNWRIVVDTCIAPDPDPAKLQSQRGTDALLVASTAIGITLLDRSAYNRYHQLDPTTPGYDDLTDLETVLLPSGAISGRKTTLPSVAFVAKSGSSPRAPCRQVYAHHFLTPRDCLSTDTDCPCDGGDTFCNVPAVVELKPPAGIDILVVDDDNFTLQALRTELRPDQPEVDGILGTDALRTLELDVDYPNARLLGRCSVDRSICTTRPELVAGDRTQVLGCIGP
jgi:hypothetical protein